MPEKKITTIKDVYSMNRRELDEFNYVLARSNLGDKSAFYNAVKSRSIELSKNENKCGGAHVIRSEIKNLSEVA